MSEVSKFLATTGAAQTTQPEARAPEVNNTNAGEMGTVLILSMPGQVSPRGV